VNTHIIQNGVVFNTIVATPEEAQTAFPESICIEAVEGGIGWLWNGTTLSAPAQPPEVITVPQSVTMRQARLALHSAGLLTSVNAAIASMPEPDKTAAQITWEFAQTVDRGFGMVPQLAAALGMTETQIDDLFIAAAQL